MRVLLVTEFEGVAQKVKNDVAEVHPDAEVVRFSSVEAFRASDDFKSRKPFEMAFINCFSEFDERGKVLRSPGVELAKEWLDARPEQKLLGITDISGKDPFNALKASHKNFSGGAFHPPSDRADNNVGYNFAAWIKAFCPAKPAHI